MAENDDLRLHEILKTLSDELTSVFEKPDVLKKYVRSFWRLRIIPDETCDNLLDPTRREGASDRLFSVLYRLVKSQNRQRQLPFFNHLLDLLEKGNEGDLADRIRLALEQQLGNTKGILPKREPMFSVPETASVCRPIGINSAPAEHNKLDSISETGYETSNMPDTGVSHVEARSTAQLVQTNGAPQQVPDHSSIVTGGHPHQPTSNDRSAPPYISTFNHPTQMHEETRQMVRRTASEAATNSYLSEEFMHSKRRSSGGVLEIQLCSELRNLIIEKEEKMLKLLEQQHEREKQRLVAETKEENYYEVINNKLRENESVTREIERIVKNLLANESEHRLQLLNSLKDIEKRVEDNSILLRNNQLPMSELHRLSGERDDKILKLLQQIQEMDTKLQIIKASEDDFHDFVRSKLHENDMVTREMERVVKNLEKNESEHHQQIVNALVTRVERRIEENYHRNRSMFHFFFGCIFVFLVCFILEKFYSRL